jgi:hypothetical protein
MYTLLAVPRGNTSDVHLNDADTPSAAGTAHLNDDWDDMFVAD